MLQIVNLTKYGVSIEDTFSERESVNQWSRDGIVYLSVCQKSSRQTLLMVTKTLNANQVTIHKHCKSKLNKLVRKFRASVRKEGRLNKIKTWTICIAYRS